MVKAVSLALDRPQLLDDLWPLRALQMESGRTTSADPDGEAENLAMLFRAAGELSTVTQMKVKSLKDLAVLQEGDQLFVGLPKESTGKPHLVYVGQAGGKILDQEVVRQQLPENLTAGFTFHLMKLAVSEDGLQLFVRRR